jgi:hypothetical protein
MPASPPSSPKPRDIGELDSLIGDASPVRLSERNAGALAARGVNLGRNSVSKPEPPKPESKPKPPTSSIPSLSRKPEPKPEPGPSKPEPEPPKPESKPKPPTSSSPSPSPSRKPEPKPKPKHGPGPSPSSLDAQPRGAPATAPQTPNSSARGGIGDASSNSKGCRWFDAISSKVDAVKAWWMGWTHPFVRDCCYCACTFGYYFSSIAADVRGWFCPWLCPAGQAADFAASCAEVAVNLA